MSEFAGPVLLVDYDAAVRNALKFALEVEGLTVRTYGSGAELLADPALPWCGCLVVDFNLPGMTGIELVRRLGDRHLHYPALLVTSGTAQSLEEYATHPDIQEVLEKPLQDDALLNGIHAALTASSLTFGITRRRTAEKAAHAMAPE